MLWELNLEQPKHMFKLMDKKIIAIFSKLFDITNFPSVRKETTLESLLLFEYNIWASMWQNLFWQSETQTSYRD